MDYLEWVCTVNLSKLSLVMQQMRVYAQKSGLKPSVSDYKKWGAKKKSGAGPRPGTSLRFSKSGNSEIERWYATHFIDSRQNAGIAEKKNIEKAEESEENTV